MKSHPVPSSEDVPPLRSLFLYVTDECNQHCSHCWINPLQEGKSRTEHPTVQDYIRFIEAARPLGLKHIKLTGGEPLLSKDACVVADYVSARNISCTIETNAMLIEANDAHFFRNRKIHIAVSLDGSNEVMHDARRGTKGAFVRTIHAIQLLTAAEVCVSVTCAVSKSNVNDLETILELLGSLTGKKTVVFKINPIVPVGRAARMNADGEVLSARDLLHLAAVVDQHLVPRFKALGIKVVLQLEPAFFSVESIMRGNAATGAYHCGFLSLLSVLADGNITFCGIGYTMPHLIMGNIRDKYDLAQIWNTSELLRDVRRTVRGKLEGVCGHCLFHSVCLGGCRALAMVGTLSLAQSPSTCQSLYDAGLFPATRLDEEVVEQYSECCRQLRSVKGEQQSQRSIDLDSFQ